MGCGAGLINLKCPRCAKRISILSVRKRLNCPACNQVLNSNVRTVEIGGLILVGIVTGLAPTERFSGFSAFLLYAGIGLLGVLVASLFLRLFKDPEPASSGQQPVE